VRIDILTLFPGMFSGPFEESILKRAREKNLLQVNVINIRDFARDKHQVTDDYPFGGGVGMVMKPEPIFAAVDHVLAQRAERALDRWPEQNQSGTASSGNENVFPATPEGATLVDGDGRLGDVGHGRPPRIILLCPQGRVFRQELAQELAQEEHLVFICGHYEGVDERVRSLATDEISIGDYVLTGGELAALVVIDAVVRLIPGVLGKEESAQSDSFARGLLEGPQYTRPRVFRGMAVPEILLSGNHEAIRRWRLKEALRRTWQRRPDLLARLSLSPEERELLAEVTAEEAARSTKESP